ncbi:MAG: HypC/HybG/HupF family hydrogenase formation chaperone [Sutterella sp.]|nr:HypC/HybG/HupF family hydrogenase formation chaperone [Sutterella sp.]
MCLAIPGQITQVSTNDMAICNIGGIEKEVNVALIEAPSAGDWVIVHVGFALNRIDEDEAQRTIEALKATGEYKPEEC